MTLRPGRHDRVFYYPARPLELLCRKSGEDLPAGAVLVIPEGLWVSDLCSMIGGWSAEPPERGIGAEPIDLAAEVFRQDGWIGRTVTVERASYPDPPQRRSFRAVRDGKIIATVTVNEYPPHPDDPPCSPALYFSDQYRERDGPDA
ncbi:MAG: hypothetical protein OXG37_05365 [Actinomycetia bacterium]|nr:hypothetical protein [Actinomycetes bacterium]